jgi:hypothetical protein
MFTLYDTILLMSVGTRDPMNDANVIKKGIKFFILPTPVGLDINNFLIEATHNKTLEFKKIFDYFRFGAKQIKPSELAVIIYKTDIVLLVTERVNRRTLHIRKK